jgi:hypothetical protein
MPFAFYAQFRIDDIRIALHPDGGGWAFEFTSAAHSALRGNDFVSHDFSFGFKQKLS